MTRIKFGLLPQIIIAIALGIACSFFTPAPAVRIFDTFGSIFSNFLGFIIPLLIVGLVAPGIADLGKGAGKLLAITAAIAYGSTIFAGFFSYFTTQWALPKLLKPSGTLANTVLKSADRIGITPYFSIDMPPVMGVTTALILAFLIGLGVAVVDGKRSKELLQEFRDIIVLVIQSVILPLLPIYIFAIFLKIGAEGQISTVLGLFLNVILLIFIMHVLLLLLQFTIAGIVAKKNPLKALLTMLPAYVTALGTQSSAATIPVTLAQTKKNGVNAELADFVIPLCATIHLAGSMLKITACAYAIMYISGMTADLNIYAGFIMMLGITMVAAPGVPGGAIMAAVAVLRSMLGFDDTLIGLMIALYITMDSFGTACNVTGDGAIALMMDKVYLKTKN